MTDQSREHAQDAKAQPAGYAAFHPTQGWRVDLAARNKQVATAVLMRSIESAAQQGWEVQPLYGAAPSRTPAGKAGPYWICCHCDAPLSCAACGVEQPDDSAHFEAIEKERDRALALVEGASARIRQIADDCRDAATIRDKFTRDVSSADFADAYRRIALSLDAIGLSVPSTVGEPK